MIAHKILCLLFLQAVVVLAEPLNENQFGNVEENQIESKRSSTSDGNVQFIDAK